MNNEIELNEEQLAEVAGGFSLNITKITQSAHNSLEQSNVAVAPTVGFATSGKKGTTAFEQMGAQIGLGNIAVQSSSNG